MTQLSEYQPLSFESIHIGSEEQTLWLNKRYPRHSDNHTRLNLISTLDGSLSGIDGTSDTITAGADRIILKHIRSVSDVVLVGAQTIRQEKYRTPSATRIATITNTGDLTGNQFDPTSAGIIVFCSASKVQEVSRNLAGIKHEIIPIATEDPGELVAGSVQKLREMGLSQIVCEGGPSLANQMLKQHLIDEICLSIRPIAQGANSAGLELNIDRNAKLLGALADTAGISYLRLRPTSPQRD